MGVGGVGVIPSFLDESMSDGPSILLNVMKNSSPVTGHDSPPEAIYDPPTEKITLQ